MRPMSVTALSAVNAATDGAQASSPILTEFTFAFSIMTISTGSPVGVVKIQVSNDDTIHTPSHWVDLASSTTAVSSATTYLMPKTEICYNWLRVVYTKTSGTGAVTCVIKTLG